MAIAAVPTQARATEIMSVRMRTHHQAEAQAPSTLSFLVRRSKVRAMNTTLYLLVSFLSSFDHSMLLVSPIFLRVDRSALIPLTRTRTCTTRFLSLAAELGEHVPAAVEN